MTPINQKCSYKWQLDGDWGEVGCGSDYLCGIEDFPYYSENFLKISFSKPIASIVFKIHYLKFLASILDLMHCSDFVFIISTTFKGKLTLGTSVEAAIENYSAKVGLRSSAIRKMEHKFIPRSIKNNFAGIFT